MESLKQAVDLLHAVLGDLDKIPVEGLRKQRTFLDCADGIQTAARAILHYVQTQETKESTALQKNEAVAETGVKEAKVDGR